MTKLQELLMIAGSAAANSNSATHRAVACRDIDRLGEEWTDGLSTELALLVHAIGAAVRALASVTTCGQRVAVARSVSDLVAAARMCTRQQRAQDCEVPGMERLYWLD